MLHVKLINCTLTKKSQVNMRRMLHIDVMIKYLSCMLGAEVCHYSTAIYRYVYINRIIFICLTVEGMSMVSAFAPTPLTYRWYQTQ